ncbi:hypothetical protein [Deinococcus humi]|uniref:Uncharacterized protein n=1 Tax=Deinococcus humi TaxID=662880 RepID=A0A7W8NEI6_9DEIO|nr:hypothetical protein [Deinococcus humi]MBB5364379.1 hypothetical protein [Deinococcus humi]GGO33356.1 hypothetical protein GCM10008949_32380 [Deinococcus humi]
MDGPRYTRGQPIIVWKSGQGDVLCDPIRFPNVAWLLAAVMGVAVTTARTKGLQTILGSGLTLLALVLTVCVYPVHGWTWTNHAALTALCSATTAGSFITTRVAHLSGTMDKAATVARNSYASTRSACLWLGLCSVSWAP